MQIIKRDVGRGANSGVKDGRLAVRHHTTRKHRDGLWVPAETVAFAPSVTNLKVSFIRQASPTKLPPSVGSLCSATPLSRVSLPERSVGLSVSGAVAPSAPALRLTRELVSSAGVF